MRFYWQHDVFLELVIVYIGKYLFLQKVDVTHTYNAFFKFSNFVVKKLPTHFLTALVFWLMVAVFIFILVMD